VITDSNYAEAMLRYFIKKGDPKSGGFRPRVVIRFPHTAVEKAGRLQHPGGRAGVFEFPESKAADWSGPADFGTAGQQVCDIGGGTTDVAVFSLATLSRAIGYASPVTRWTTRLSTT